MGRVRVKKIRRQGDGDGQMHSSYLQSDPALDTTNTRRYGAEEMGRVRVKKIRRQGDGEG